SRLWRHAVAVSLAARRLAREANDPAADQVARAGLLHNLGAWAVAAVDPEWLPRWLWTDDGRRRQFECGSLGEEGSSLGRTRAEGWGLAPLVVEAAWLHADLGLRLGFGREAGGSNRLGLVQRAYACAGQTPWGLSAPEPSGHAPHDARVKVLIAEVQSRC